MARAALAAVLACAGGCSTSHGTDDRCEERPFRCFRGSSTECCGAEPATATCVDGAWTCADGFVPEASCPTSTPSGACMAPPPPPACEGDAFECRSEPTTTSMGCCGRSTGFAVCVDGEWDCGPTGGVPASSCHPPAPSGECGVPPFDAGPADAGTSACAGLGAAACAADPDCAPHFDDSCCPSCSEGPCADCFDPDYIGCIPFDDCRSPTCGAVPAWDCFPSAPDCSSATPIDLDSCTAYGCVPSFPPGDGDPSLADATCTPITGNSCTVACRRLPPTCPDGTVPEGDGSCYTDRCIPAFVCE